MTTSPSPPSVAGDGDASLALLGRYRIERMINESASGTTWLVHDITIKERLRFVVKMFAVGAASPGRATETFVSRLAPLRAKRIPGLPRLEDVRSTGGRHFMVTEWQEAEPLDQSITEHRADFPSDVARHLVYTLARAVTEMHALGFLHLDLKPANVLYDRQQGVLRLLDWGHALFAVGHDRPIAMINGGHIDAVPYMSNGLLCGEPPCEQDDVYALACIAYELLTGTHPYARRSAVEVASLGLVPTRVADLNDAENDVLARALSPRRDPGVTAEALSRAFGPVGPPRRIAVAPPPKRRPRLSLTGALLGAVALAVLIGFNVLSFFNDAQLTANDRAAAARSADRSARAATTQPGTAPTGIPAKAGTNTHPVPAETASTSDNAAVTLSTSTAVAPTSEPPSTPTHETALEPAGAAPRPRAVAARSDPEPRRVVSSEPVGAPTVAVAESRPSAPVADPPVTPPSPPPVTIAAVSPAVIERAPAPLREAPRCPTCECATLDAKRNFTNEPLRLEEQVYFRASCR